MLREYGDNFHRKIVAEMKDRSSAILKNEDAEMHKTIGQKIPRMRISIMHSFCLNVVNLFWSWRAGSSRARMFSMSSLSLTPGCSR